MRLPPEDRRCTARSKQTGQRCRQYAVPGKQVCHYHGGRSLAGPFSRTFKHGRYSNVLPTGLTAAYQRSLSDPDLLDLSSELALIDSRIVDVLRRMAAGEGQSWLALDATARAFGTARAQGDVAGMERHLSTLLRQIERGGADEAAWADLRALVEQRRKLTETERKRRVELQLSLDRAEALTMARYLAEAVASHVADPAVLAAIGADFARVLQSSVTDEPVA